MVSLAFVCSETLLAGVVGAAEGAGVEGVEIGGELTVEGPWEVKPGTEKKEKEGKYHYSQH